MSCNLRIICQHPLMLPTVAREIQSLPCALPTIPRVGYAPNSWFLDVVIHLARSGYRTEADFTGTTSTMHINHFPAPKLNFSMPSILIQICECFCAITSGELFHPPASFDSLSMAPIHLICIDWLLLDQTSLWQDLHSLTLTQLLWCHLIWQDASEEFRKHVKNPRRPTA